jgi:transposase-like protein
MDNDVLVRPGWLEKMYECAEQTGAGIVGPLYLWGNDAEAGRIHMAGGELAAQVTENGVVLQERHRHFNRRLEDVELHREECSFVEFHCMMMRREVFQAPGTFDEGIVCVHEHIHASLTARSLGYPTYLEPEAKIVYLAFYPYLLPELPVYRRRWSHEAGESSLRAFAKRWGVIDDERSFGDVRKFLVRHRAEVDPLRASLQDGRISHAPMHERDHKQTLTGLIEGARARGYTPEDLQQIHQAHWTALVLSNGGYRPCGRPFINHLAGTASVLVHYGFETRLIQAALLHSAYTHAPRFFGNPGETVEAVASKLGGKDSALERAVRAYTVRASRWQAILEQGGGMDAVTMDDAGTAAIAVANAVDLILSGEVRTTGRQDEEDKAILSQAPEICRILGVPGLAASAARLQIEANAAVALKQPGAVASFRIEGTKIVPMVNPAFSQTQASVAEPVAIGGD